MITFLYAQIAVIHFLDFDTSQEFKNNLQPNSHFMNIFINESNAHEAMINIITSNQKIHSFIFNFSNENVYKNSCFHKVIQKIMYTYSPVEIFINILEENRNTQETIKKLIDSGIKKNPEITDTILLRCPETLLFYINFIYNLNTKMFKTKKFSHITKFFINNHSYNPADTPDSKAPNSFEDPIKILFTEATRPLILSGVNICMIVERKTTLTLSKTPLRASKKIER